MVLGWVELRQYHLSKFDIQACFSLVCGSIHLSSLLSAMEDDVPHRIDKLKKVEACFSIPVTNWAGNPLMLNGIGYVRVSGKDGGANSLSPDAEGIKYVVALGIGPLLL